MNRCNEYRSCCRKTKFLLANNKLFYTFIWKYKPKNQRLYILGNDLQPNCYYCYYIIELESKYYFSFIPIISIIKSTLLCFRFERSYRISKTILIPIFHPLIDEIFETYFSYGLKSAKKCLSFDTRDLEMKSEKRKERPDFCRSGLLI